MKPSGKNPSRKPTDAMSDRDLFRILRQSRQRLNLRRLRRAITVTGRPRAEEWTRSEEALLGKIPDSAVAKRLGRTTTAVALHRSRLGIPKYGSPARLHKDWTESELALLGTLPDREAARKLHRTQIAVMTKRRQLKVPAKIEGYHRWNREEEALLRKKRPDSEIARLLKIPVGAVRKRRLALKIYLRVPTPRRFQKWTRAEDALLGTAPDTMIARRLKCAESTVCVRRQKLGIRAFVPNWTPSEDRLFKRYSDREIARKLGRTVGAVGRRRRKLGLPQVDPPFLWWKPAEDKLLGTRPDAEIASRLGRSVDSVKNRRLVLGIKFSNVGRPPRSGRAHNQQHNRR